MRVKKFLRAAFVIFLIVAGVACLVAYAFVNGSSAQIRLDTGDLRYLFLGIPFQYQRMPEPERSQLIALAAGSKILTPEWHSCATRIGSNNADLMCRSFYFRATAWIGVDRPLAQMIVGDIAAYVRNTEARQGLPDSFGMLAFVIDQDNNGKWHVKQNWQRDDLVLEYLRQKSYSLPTTQMAN